MSFFDLYQFIYHQPLRTIIGWMVILTFTWAALRLVSGVSRPSAAAWMWTNRVLCVCSVIGVLLVTVLARNGGETGFSLRLFVPPTEPGPRDEYARMMLMNAFLFLPLGMSLGSSWRDTMPIWKQIEWTAVGGFAVTFTCELLQTILHRGTFETDDLTMNLAGVLLGLTHTVIAFGLVRAMKTAARLIKKKSS